MGGSDLTVVERIGAAFLAAYGAYPYYASGLALLVRRVVEIPSASMAVTRDGILLIDPRFVTECTVRQVAEAVVHELSHLLRDHAGRADRVPNVDHYRWNVAADCEINMGLQVDHLPAGACLPGRFELPDGWLAEEYYDKLPPLVEETRFVCSGWCGSGSGGEVMEGEPPPGSEAGRSAAEVARVRSEVAVAVTERAARRSGSVPGDVLRWAQFELRPPRVNWRDMLRRYVRFDLSSAAGKADYTWGRPGRRQACQSSTSVALGGEDVVLPSLRGAQASVAIGLDTSGSMGQAELEDALSEVEGILRAAGTSATFLAFDCRVTGSPLKISSAAEAARHLRGGGGTDFRVVFEAVEKMRPRPRLLILVTDGCGPAPDYPPAGTDVLWVLVGDRSRRPTTWGQHVFVKEDVE